MHWFLHFTFLQKTAHANIPWCWDGIFALREAHHKFSLTVLLPSMYLLMVYMSAALLLHLYFSYVYVCTSVKLSNCQSCLPDLHANVVLMFSSAL